MNALQNVIRPAKLLPNIRVAAHVIYKNGASCARLFSNLYEAPYTNEEQKQILQVLNESNAEELSRFNITKNRIHNLQRFRQKHGHFCTLDEILEVDGLGVKVLEKLCESILICTTPPEKEGVIQEDEQKKEVKTNSKAHLTQLLTPSLHPNKRNTLHTVVGIHIGVNAITWAHMDRTGNLLDWDLYDLSFSSKKVHLTSLFKVVQNMCERIPQADLYVMEDKEASRQTSQPKPAVMSVSLQNCQLTAMLVALLNYSTPFDTEASSDHHVYFLRSRLSARLFRSLIGAERISAQTVVLKILNEINEDDNVPLDDYTPIIVGEKLKQKYLCRNAVDKENFCWSLLLTMAFMDLIVNQNPRSLQHIRNGKRT